MDNLGQIFQRMGMFSPTQPGERLSDKQLAEYNTRYQEKLHLSNCLRCNGRSTDPAWPCEKDPAYSQKVTYCRAGVPWPATMTFSTFETIPGTAVALAVATKMAVAPEGWLTLLGEYGTGKTHLAMAAVYALLDQGQRAWFTTAGELLDRWRSRYGKEEMDFGQMFQSDCLRPSLVVVDDLGSERGTEWAMERLTMFLDTRYGRNLPTIITTNNDKPTLARRSGGRIADRVFDHHTGKVQVVVMDCPSYRTD